MVALVSTEMAGGGPSAGKTGGSFAAFAFIWRHVRAQRSPRWRVVGTKGGVLAKGADM